MKFIHVLNQKGKRITSICADNMQDLGEEDLLKKAKKMYPDAAQYIYGDYDMLQQFISGNVYVDGKFIPQSNSEESIEEQDSISNIRIDNTALLEILANQEERLQSLEDK